MGKISLVVPTYNERENLPTLIEALMSVLKGYALEIIVVDDSSPDGTGEVAEQLSRIYGNVKVIHHGGKKGLASAVIAGFNYTSERILGAIDADLQHPPENICRMLKEIQNGVDVVIASRYVEGGGIEDWSKQRELVSKIASLLTRIIFPKIRNIRDPLSGLFLVKREVLEGVNLNPIGYKILLEILAKGTYDKVVEVPYIFQKRKKGKSKLGLKVQIDYIRHLWRLYCFKFRTVSKGVGFFRNI